MIPKDKLMHAAAGLAAALISLALWMLAECGDLAPLSGAPAAVVLGCLIASTTKEGADWLDNRIRPGSHGVELLDIVATTLPGIILALAAQQVLTVAGAA